LLLFSLAAWVISYRVASAAVFLGLILGLHWIFKFFLFFSRRRYKTRVFFGSVLGLFVYLLVGRIVCTTEYMAEHMRTYFRARKISVIHNFNDQPWCSDISQPVFQQSYCIHVGRFVPQKRHQFLLEVWASRGSLPDLVLLTQHSPELDIEIQRLGLEDRVIVVGYVQDPMPLIGASQCLVLCSDYEGFPSVLLEAMHAKTRIASGSCGGVASEICSRVPEVICRNDSIQEFGADLEEILKRPVPDYSTTLSWYSRERANHLWSALIDQMV